MVTFELTAGVLRLEKPLLMVSETMVTPLVSDSLLSVLLKGMPSALLKCLDV